MLIDSSYFIGEINIPNTQYSDVSSLIDALIKAHETEFLNNLLGYELSKAFNASLLTGDPEQRFKDLLFGFEYDYFGTKYRWNGLISVLSDDPQVNVGVNQDLFITVGSEGGPAADETVYSNPYLKDKNYRVVQRGFGPLEPNVNYTINPLGGFTLINGLVFSQADTFNIQITSVVLNATQAPVTNVPSSPIADYVYFYWQRNNATNTSGIGEVKSEGVNSSIATAAYKSTFAWNSMVDKLFPLVRSLRYDTEKWPEFTKHHNLRKHNELCSKINALNI